MLRSLGLGSVSNRHSRQQPQRRRRRRRRRQHHVNRIATMVLGQEEDDVDATREQKNRKKASLLHDRGQFFTPTGPRNSLAWRLSYDFVVAVACTAVQHICCITQRLRHTCTCMCIIHVCDIDKLVYAVFVVRLLVRLSESPLWLA